MTLLSISSFSYYEQANIPRDKIFEIADFDLFENMLFLYSILEDKHFVVKVKSQNLLDVIPDNEVLKNQPYFFRKIDDDKYIVFDD